MARSTEPAPAVPHWHCGFNQPGYLPVSEPETHSSFEAARDSLVVDMEMHAGSEESWAEDHDCDDVPCPTFGDSCQLQRASAIRHTRDELVAIAEGDWQAYAADLAYWVRSCASIDCVEGLAAAVARDFADEGSALNALALTGAVLAGAAEEADENRQAATAADQSDLEVLCSYIAAVGERPPVLGWLIR